MNFLKLQKAIKKIKEEADALPRTEENKDRFRSLLNERDDLIAQFVLYHENRASMLRDAGFTTWWQPGMPIND